MWALLDSNQVVKHITTVPQEGYGWVQCFEDTYIGHTHDNGVFQKTVIDPHTLQQKAHIAMTRADVVAVRCFKAGKPYPEEWFQYSNALRAIDNGTDTTSVSLPERPPYPAGT